MNVLPAWRKGITGTGVVVTILDDGIERDHPDLKKNYVSSLTQSIDFIDERIKTTTDIVIKINTN